MDETREENQTTERTPRLTVRQILDRLRLSDVHQKPRYWFRLLQSFFLVLTLGLLIGCFANLPDSVQPIGPGLILVGSQLNGVGAALSYVAFALAITSLTTILSYLVDPLRGSLTQVLAHAFTALALLIAWVLQVAIVSTRACDAISADRPGPVFSSGRYQYNSLCAISNTLVAFLILTWLTFCMTAWWAVCYRRAQLANDSNVQSTNNEDPTGFQTTVSSSR